MDIYICFCVTIFVSSNFSNMLTLMRSESISVSVCSSEGFWEKWLLIAVKFLRLNLRSYDDKFWLFFGQKWNCKKSGPKLRLIKMIADFLGQQTEGAYLKYEAE